jgi:SAM-dependent methyltransferase
MEPDSQRTRTEDGVTAARPAPGGEPHTHQRPAAKKSQPFDSMAALYDRTRVFDQACFDSALDLLAQRFPPRDFPTLFEPGIGTGRIAIPLAQRGYKVVGVDIAPEMLGLLENRLAASPDSLAIRYQQADARRLPFREGIFDIGVAVHLFYFIDEWKQAADELLRVVSPDGPLVLMHTGMGAEVPLLNERYKQLCAEQGCSLKEVGVRSTSEVVDYFGSLGCHIEWMRDRWRWTSRIRLDEALGYIGSRAYSFATIASNDTHSLAVGRLESELLRRFGDLSGEVEVPNEIRLAVILRGGRERR